MTSSLIHATRAEDPAAEIAEKALALNTALQIALDGLCGIGLTAAPATADLALFTVRKVQEKLDGTL